ncbi:FkbM family methyltransferase [Seohaeicola saemankumensis]|uniref:FkbM family methyltransferase n=1 Tax=Seohaeicola saemankumensis TaxID=481181 RepID=A0ABW3TA38_9RHOB
MTINQSDNRADETRDMKMAAANKKAQARAFCSAVFGSVVSERTLGTCYQAQDSTASATLAGKKAPKTKKLIRKFEIFLLSRVNQLRNSLRQVRKKSQARRAARLRQAHASSGFALGQAEITQKLRDIELGVSALSADMQVLRARVDMLVNRNLIQLVDERVAVRTPYGYVICPQNEYHLIIHILEGGAYEPGTCRVIESIIKPGDHVIDVGAQVGLLTLTMGRAVGASGKVLAIEASELLVDCIRRTLSTNGLLKNCDVLQMAASDRVGTSTFHLAEISGHSSLVSLSEESREIKVQTAPIDEIVSAGDNISLVKVDVEGAELLVLQGMTRVIEENPEIILIVEFGPSHLVRINKTINQWLGAFRDRGFDQIFEIDEMSAACRPLRSEIELAKVHSLNLVFARGSSSRITRIPQS